jgi:hypothetical protein
MPESTGPGPQDLGTAAPAADTPDTGARTPAAPRRSPAARPRGRRRTSSRAPAGRGRRRRRRRRVRRGDVAVEAVVLCGVQAAARRPSTPSGSAHARAHQPGPAAHAPPDAALPRGVPRERATLRGRPGDATVAERRAFVEPARATRFRSSPTGSTSGGGRRRAQRVALRRAAVPEKAVRGTAKRLEPPTAAEGVERGGPDRA